MKFKRIIAMLAAGFMLTSTAAFADALRYDDKRNVQMESRQQPNDIIFEDFISVEPGVLPSGMSVTGADGYGTTELFEVSPGVTKNCFKYTDTSHDDEYTGPTATYSTGTQTGMVGVEIRYKYVPDGTSSYSTFGIQLNGTQGMATKSVVISADGSTYLNYGGVGDFGLEKSPILQNTWYTIKFVVDFDNQVMDVMLKNEGTGVVTQAIGSPFIENKEFTDLTNIKFTSSKYGGTWMIDYIRVSRETERMQEYEDPNIKKGVPAELVDGPVSDAVEGRININLNGIYKYTTQKPYLSENNNVMVFAKNVASIFKMGYYYSPESITIKNADNSFTFEDQSTAADYNGKSITLSSACALSDGKLFVPIEDIATALGYNCSFNEEEQTLYITNEAQEAQEGGNTVEEN